MGGKTSEEEGERYGEGDHIRIPAIGCKHWLVRCLLIGSPNQQKAHGCRKDGHVADHNITWPLTFGRNIVAQILLFGEDVKVLRANFEQLRHLGIGDPHFQSFLKLFSGQFGNGFKAHLYKRHKTTIHNCATTKEPQYNAFFTQPRNLGETVEIHIPRCAVFQGDLKGTCPGACET